jgi:hypothetical protein
MLKGIPEILSPDLLKIMMEMGHGEETVPDVITVLSIWNRYEVIIGMYDKREKKHMLWSQRAKKRFMEM